MKRLHAYIVLFLLIIGTMLLYGKLTRPWTGYGGRSIGLFALEYPLLFVAASVPFLPRWGHLRQNIIAAMAALAPLVAGYAVFDVFYHFQHRVSRFSDLRNVLTLWDFSPPLFAGLVLLMLVSLIPTAVLLHRDIRRRKESRRYLFRRIALRISLAVFLIVLCAFSDLPFLYETRCLGFVRRSDFVNIDSYGRLASTIYYTGRSREATARLQQTTRTSSRDPLSLAIERKRNVYMIVMESLMDPRLLKDATFTRSPLYEEMPVLLGDSMFSMAVSPIYGGGTAQSEFELLCGLPALARIESIDFNVLGGHPVKSLVTDLERQGYTSVAVVASNPEYFNAAAAYESIGFDQVFFGGLAEIFKNGRSERVIFDGDLLEQNLEYIRTRFVAAGKPVVSYVLGMYGHYPFERDSVRHPQVLRAFVHGEHHADVEELANQFYYRTRALHRALTTLRAFDPDAVVLVLADHLPGVLKTDLHYGMGDKDNIFLMLNGGFRWRPETKPRYYELPYVIMSMLTSTTVAVPGDAELEDMYFTRLAESKGLR